MTLIDRYLRARNVAEKNNDRGLVREIEFHLRRYGWKPDGDNAEHVEQRLEEQVRPRRGRPPVRRDLPPVPPDAA